MRSVLMVSMGSVLLALGCSSIRLSKFDPEDVPLPQELSAEDRERFEVKSIVDPTEPGAPKEQPKPQKREVREVKDEKPAEVEPFRWPNRNPKKRNPVWVGEKVVLNVSYLGMSAGQFVIEVNPLKRIDERDVFHIQLSAKSSKLFSMFYRLDDTIQSYWDVFGLFSHRFRLVLDESKQTRDALEIYDSRKRQTVYWNRWERKDKPKVDQKVVKEIPAFPQDSVSVLFYLRYINLNVGETVRLPVVSEGKTWQAEIDVVRKEKIKTSAGTFDAIVVEPRMKYRGVIKQRGKTHVWLSDDERRFPLRLHADVKVGSIRAEVESIELGDSTWTEALLK